MKVSNENYQNPLADFIFSLRKKALRKKRDFTNEQLIKPVSFWTKPDRLLDEIGKEFTIILRTKGCSWALGNYGGCSMCGYVQDANIKEVPSHYLIKQFDYALERKLNEIKDPQNNYILKIFNSGSFFDDSELDIAVRMHIYRKIAEIKNIKEFVIESRVEYITADQLSNLKNNLKNKYIEIGIGLETTNDYIRNHYINKGLVYEQFLKAVELCRKYDIGVRAYLLLKPPFLNEQGAIDDCIDSIRSLISLKVNSISINPLNIQKGSLTEYLWYQNRYRPPWFYSLFKCLKKAIKQEDLKNTRIVSDPSGAGTKRGIHNCLKCDEKMISLLKDFVLNQEINRLRYYKEVDCDCKIKYCMERDYH